MVLICGALVFDLEKKIKMKIISLSIAPVLCFITLISSCTPHEVNVSFCVQERQGRLCTTTWNATPTAIKPTVWLSKVPKCHGAPTFQTNFLLRRHSFCEYECVCVCTSCSAGGRTPASPSGRGDSVSVIVHQAVSRLTQIITKMADAALSPWFGVTMCVCVVLCVYGFQSHI